MKHPTSARDLRRSTALGPLRKFASVLAPACLHRRGIRPPGCPAPLMSPGLGLRPRPPPLLRCAGHPGGLIRQQWLFATTACHPCGLPRAWGGRCSEVKEETAPARASSGDMSVSGRPAPAARTDASTRAAPRHSFVNVRNGPRAVDRRRSRALDGCLILGAIGGDATVTTLWRPVWRPVRCSCEQPLRKIVHSSMVGRVGIEPTTKGL